jgi:hypothetical protein
LTAPEPTKEVTNDQIAKIVQTTALGIASHVLRRGAKDDCDPLTCMTLAAEINKLAEMWSKADYFNYDESTIDDA